LEKGRVATTPFSILVQVLINISKVLEDSKNKKETISSLLSIMAPSSIQFSNQISIELLKINELKKIIPLTYIHSLSQTS